MSAPGAVFDVQLTGFEQVERNFKALPLVLQRKFLRPAMRDGAKVLRSFVTAAAAAISPGRTGSGRMAKHIRIKAMKRSRAKGGRIGFVVITGRRPELGIGGDDPGYYPAHLELGYRTGRRVQGPLQYDPTQRVKGRFSRKDRTKAEAAEELQQGRRRIPGRHWMRNALRAGEASARDEVARSLERRMRESSGVDDQAEFDRSVSVEFEEDFVFGGGTGL